MGTMGATIRGAYRYELWRQWHTNAMHAVWIMLNPSTADHETNDPTIRRCISFTKAWGLGGLTVVNLFALRATDPEELRSAADPVGPDNDAEILKAVNDAGRAIVVCAWGAHPFARDRAEHVQRLLRDEAGGATLGCLGRTKDGSPRHPLYVRSDTDVLEFDDYLPQDRLVPLTRQGRLLSLDDRMAIYLDR